jgi:dihydroxyacid dehydratase/phosphogluconate dehydratase
MKLYQITPQDAQLATVPPLNLAELKALHNALAVDVATGGGTTPGVNSEALLVKVGKIIEQSAPPRA